MNKLLNCIFKMKFLIAALFAFAAGVSAEAETFELKARASMTPVELNKGDVCRFTLVNGQTRTIEYLGTESSVLEIPATEGLVATLTMRLRIDGAEIPFRRYFATQESFYEPAVVNGMTIFPDSTLEYLQKTVPMRYPAKGAMRHHPWKDCRIVVQDATLPLCPEKLHPWFLDKRMDNLFLPIGDAYHGGDCWLGPFSYGQAHGGMDLRMERGSLLYAPFAMDDQWMPLYAKKGRGGSSRWRGVRRFPDGTYWSLNTSHVIDCVVPERTAVTNGQAYCTAAGTAVGEYDHTHFELHICRDLNPKIDDKVWDTGWGKETEVKNDCPKGQPEFYNLDPWVLFWETFVQLREARALPSAKIAPFSPTKVGVKTCFRSARSLPKGALAVWTFNDGVAATGEEVTHVFSKGGAHVVTLTVIDGKGLRLRDTAHISVADATVEGPLLGVRADDVSFVELKPGDLPAWGEKLKFDPYSVGREEDLVFFDRVKGGAMKPPLVAKEDFTPAIRRHIYGDGEMGYVEVFVRAKACNPGRIYDKEFTLHVESAGASYFHTPCFWVQHHFDKKRRWYEISGARAEKGQFVRFMPRLRGGRWRVEDTYAATHVPGSSYTVKVKAKDGVHTVRFSPLKDLVIGEFDFAEGEGYVQIEAENSLGPIYVASLKFTPIKLEPPKYITQERLDEVRALRKSLEKEIRDIAAAAEYPSSAAFDPSQWLPVARVMPLFTIGSLTSAKFFAAITDEYASKDVIPGNRADWEEFISWIYVRTWALDLKDKWMNEILKRPFRPFSGEKTPRAKRLEELSARLAKAIAEADGL